MRDAIYGIVIVAVAIVSWHVSAAVQPTYEATPRIDTVEVEAEEPDRAPPTPPDIRITHQPADIVLDTCVAAPTSMKDEPLSLVDDAPIAVQGRDVTLTRFDIDDRAWTQDVFRVQRSRFSIAPTLHASADPYAQRISAGLALRWGRLTITPTYGMTQTDDTRLTWGVQVRTTLTRWEW